MLVNKRSWLGIVMLSSIGWWLASGCKEVALAEQLHNVPDAAWSSSRTDTFRFQVKDTTAAYRMSVVLRHNNQYPYRNAWIRVGLLQPGSDSIPFQDFNLPVATADSWLGTGMGDVYEVRPYLFEKPVTFPVSGEVVVTMQHIMRQDPLPGVLQVGVRLEPE